MSDTKKVIFEVKDVRKTFRSSEGQELVVLENVNFKMHENEIVALLGKSGSGKSTLLRIIAGLVKPSGGQVLYHDKPVTKPVQGIAMVFQSFALMPWLTVLENVELGLEALGIPRQERRKRALKAIDTIGLDGFESAFPKELSGGMRQRVGFARALVVEPELLLMDEPFSALDVLTAENLRGDLLDLWTSNKTRTKGILFVTHNIEEAAQIADRIIIFASDPGHIRAELNPSSAVPRNLQDLHFRKLVDDIYTLMTTSERSKVRPGDAGRDYKKMELGYRLPDAGVSELTGLVDALAQQTDGPVDLPLLAEQLHLEADELFQLTEALEILDFATVSKGDIALTEAGNTFADANILERKKLFAKQLEKHVPLAKHIRTRLELRPNNRELEDVFLSELEAYLTNAEADRVLTVIIDWGRYAEIFAYDYDSGILSLENPK
ncbi:AAA-associated domain-containing protein [Candidatus Berkiella cookevillensis]|uniref:AAA-associated domain-containing protein n=1 Tax=Candidatus Berkiella cookevillensis TaxID=437022 RepID=A0A0Q9YRZ0_9GAMM|nr:nitrate/sulfonate/bicarbonate ABC transporter ATP-binding protein [Candidatus Berkiella cookevillensis]MCS5708863.1 AAA-associated domain-containing protein [Candidatus Berkiella cookevillensis]